MWPWNASPWKMRGSGIAANPQNSYHSYRLGFLVGAGAYPFADLRQESPVRINTPLNKQYLKNTHKSLTLVDCVSKVSFQSPNSTQIGF